MNKPVLFFMILSCGVGMLASRDANATCRGAGTRTDSVCLGFSTAQACRQAPAHLLCSWMPVATAASACQPTAVGLNLLGARFLTSTIEVRDREISLPTNPNDGGRQVFRHRLIPPGWVYEVIGGNRPTQNPVALESSRTDQPVCSTERSEVVKTSEICWHPGNAQTPPYILMREISSDRTPPREIRVSMDRTNTATISQLGGGNILSSQTFTNLQARGYSGPGATLGTAEIEYFGRLPVTPDPLNLTCTPIASTAGAPPASVPPRTSVPRGRVQ